MCQNHLIWPEEQVVWAEPGINPEKWYTQISMGYSDKNGSPNLGKMTWPCDSQQKKRTCRIVNFAILTSHRVEIK